MRRLLGLFLLIGLAGIPLPDARAQTADGLVDPDPQPRWFKGNLHTHSFWSDGNDYPEMIADWYRRHGYHFLALSDHNVLSQGPNWSSVYQANKRAKQGGLALYPQRFGEAWV